MKRLLATAVVTVLTGVALASGAVHKTRGPRQIPMRAPRRSQIPTRTIRERPRRRCKQLYRGAGKSHIEAAGYSNISGLTKDKDGIWRGSAARGGATVDVGLDYQGNVVTSTAFPK